MSRTEVFWNRTAMMWQAAQLNTSFEQAKDYRLTASGEVAVGGLLDYGTAGRRNRQTPECLEKIK
jgi:hypothetical protein